MKKSILSIVVLALLCIGCGSNVDQNEASISTVESNTQNEILNKYVEFELTTDVSSLSADEKEIIKILINAGEIMNELFWYEAYGDKSELMERISDPSLKKAAEINYGPWDRLAGNEPFIEGVGQKAPGANFYPADITKAEFEASDLEDKESQYTFLRRDKDGALISVPYYQQFAEQIAQVASYLEDAANLAKNDQLKNYLNLRAAALRNDQYRESDMAWLDMKTNKIDVVIGPIESYEDQLYGYKTAHEAYVLVKDMEWSKKLAKYADFLPSLQEGLPADDKYKQEKPGSDTELNAYDVIYYAGDCNAGSKTIAINLPNDEVVQLEKGTRRLQLKNAMKAKFDKILIPISEVLIDESQRNHITFDAFFSNTMFHEVAHGLGIKNTINGKGTVRAALKEHASALEEGKADILGLYMIQQLHKRGELSGDLHDYYVTFMTSVFRSVRFGASSAHGKANMIRFNYFKEKNAFEYDDDKGTYKVIFENMESAMESLSSQILALQGEGDYAGVDSLVKSYGGIGEDLQKDLDRLTAKNIPVDVVFKQGIDQLGL